jgi:hypothetical protein
MRANGLRLPSLGVVGFVVATACAVAFTACGGGGGGGGGGGTAPVNSNTPPPPPPPVGTPPPPPAPTPPPPPAGTNPALPGATGAYAVPQLFPASDAWNTDISAYPVDTTNSANYVGSIGNGVALHPDFGTTYAGAPNGIPFIVVAGTQAQVPIDFMLYASESDPGPYPYPPNAPIEGVNNGSAPPFNGAGDQHVLVVDKDHMKLYETWMTFPPGDANANWATDANWSAANGAVWDLTKPCTGQRPAGYTSGDAAGLPILPGLVRYDEAVTAGAINHALRFTIANTQAGYIAPANHHVGSNLSLSVPPMGARFRMKASTVTTGAPPEVQVILTALKKYGMFVADVGSNWYISGAPDSRWSDSDLAYLANFHGSDFEVVVTGSIQH